MKFSNFIVIPNSYKNKFATSSNSNISKVIGISSSFMIQFAKEFRKNMKLSRKFSNESKRESINANLLKRELHSKSMLDIDILNPIRCFTKTKEIDTIIFNDDDCNLHDYDLTNNNSNFNEKTGYSKNRLSAK